LSFGFFTTAVVTGLKSMFACSGGATDLVVTAVAAVDKTPDITVGEPEANLRWVDIEATDAWLVYSPFVAIFGVAYDI